MLKEIIVVGGSITATALFVWLIILTPWQFHAGFLFGLGVAYYAVRMLHGFWIGDARYRKRGA